MAREFAPLQMGALELDMVPIFMRCTIRETSATQKAFTLIELLVVIGIIAILAALSLAVSGSVRKYTDRTKCLANLRTVGAAINSYANDHEGILPGPLWTWQSCWFDENDFGGVGTLLASYLGHSTSSEKQKMMVLVCPAWQRGAPYRQDQAFIMNTAVMVGETSVNPWGDADLDDDGSGGTDIADAAVAKRLVQLADIRLARVWAMQDLDSQNPVPKVPGGIAVKPVHGDTRNALFFDWHAESVPLDYKP